MRQPGRAGADLRDNLTTRTLGVRQLPIAVVVVDYTGLPLVLGPRVSMEMECRRAHLLLRPTLRNPTGGPLCQVLRAPQ